MQANVQIKPLSLTAMRFLSLQSQTITKVSICKTQGEEKKKS